MSGLSKESAAKLHATRIERYGVKGYSEAGKKGHATRIERIGEEAAHSEKVRVGSLGGKAPHSKPRGFAADKDKARLAALKSWETRRAKKAITERTGEA